MFNFFFLVRQNKLLVTKNKMIGTLIAIHLINQPSLLKIIL